VVELAAVELGGTRCRAATGRAAAGKAGVVAERFEVLTGNPQPTFAALVEWLAARGPFAAVAVASFGPLRLDPAARDYGRLLAESKPGWRDADVLAPFRSLAQRLVLETDVGAAALGEQLQRGGHDTLAYVTVGTGIGGGLAIDDRVHHGQLHPEMGHLRVPHDDSFAGICAAHGDCWEGLASGTALAARTGMQAEKLPDGDPAWATEAELLAQGLLAITAVAMPGTIVLGGGVMQRAGLREAVARRLAELNGGFAPLPEVVAPALGEDSALSGALEMAARAMGDSAPHRRTQNR
jgi:fructokinase